MATIGSLAVNIVARTDKFVKGINKSRQSVSTFSKTAQKATGMVKGFVGAFAAGVGIVGVTRMLQNAASEMDRLAKTSDKLGIASQNLAGLQHAAAQTGVSTSTLNMALQRMTRRVAEAAQGTGEAVKALQELGLDAKELNQLAPDQIFARVAEKMAGVANQGDKVRLAMKLFDSEGVELVNTLKLGSDGLARMQAEAEKLGIAFNREELAKVEAFNDAMDKLGKAFKGVAGKILVTITPAAVSAIETLGEYVEFASGRNPNKLRPKNAGANTAFTSPALDPGWSARTAKRLREERPFEVPIRDALARAREVQAQAPEQVTKMFGKLGQSIAKAGGDGASLFSRGLGAIGDSYERGAPGRRRSMQERTERHAEATERVSKLQEQYDKMLSGTKSQDNSRLSLSRAGSAESYRQRRSIERQADNQKVQKQQLDVLKEIRDKLDAAKQEVVELEAAGIAD